MLKSLAAWLSVLIVVVAIAAGLGTYKYQQIQAKAAMEGSFPEPIEATVSARARDGEWTPTTRTIGTVVAVRQLEVRNEIAGAIAKIGFKSGDTVAKDQVLVEFDVRQEQAALAAVEAEVALAKSTFARRDNLRNSTAYSPQDYDKAKQDLASAEARARNLAVVIDKKRITSPFEARVGITNLQPGAYLDIGTRIVTLQGVDPDAYVDFSLPQDSAALVRPGQSVKITNVAIAGGTGEAKIVAEDDSVDRANRTVQYRARATGLGATLRPGTFVDVISETSAKRKSVFVPLAAVRRSPNGQHVFVISDDGGKLRAHQRPVETGAVLDNEIAVEKGLASGELVATSGSFKLRDGVLVNTDAVASTGSPQAKTE